MARPRIEKFLDGKENLLYSIGMKLRPGPEGKPLKFRPGVRFRAYVAFITWFLKRYPDVAANAIRNSMRGSADSWPRGPKVEIVTLPNGQRALHQEGPLFNGHACAHDSGETTLPVTLAGRELGDQKTPAKVIYS